MSSTIQWCDGPRPSVNRPSHTAWFDSACCAIATGWRVWIGIDRGAELDPRRRAAHERDRGQRVEVVRDLRDPDRREAGLLGRLGVGDELRDLVAVAALLGADHQADPHRVPLPTSGVGPDPNGGSSEKWQCHSRFSRVSLRTISSDPSILAGQLPTVREGARMSRVAVITGGASGMGLASAQRLAAQGHKVALFDLDGDAATSAAEDLRQTGAVAIGIAVDVSDRAGGRRRDGEGARRARADRDHRHERGLRQVRVVHRHHARGVDPDDRGQPHRHVPLHPVRDPRHDRRGLGPDRDDLVVERAVGREPHGALRRVEGRRRRAHQGVGGRVRAERHHGQHDPARFHRHADGARGRGARRHAAASTRSRPALRCGAPERPTTSPPRARSSAPTTRATSRAS